MDYLIYLLSSNAGGPNRHSETKRIVYKALEDLSSSLGLHHIDYIFRKMESVPTNEYDEVNSILFHLLFTCLHFNCFLHTDEQPLVNLLRSLTENGIDLQQQDIVSFILINTIEDPILISVYDFFL